MQHRNPDINIKECYILNGDSVDNFCGQLRDCEELSGQQLLICFDEINALNCKFPFLFLHIEAYECQSEIRPPSSTPYESDDDNIHRGILYAVASCMVSLSKATKWAMLMTGTAFSLTQFSCTGQDLSPVRGYVKDVAPDKKLQVGDMHSLLKYYFTLSEDVLENEDVMTMLKQCCGRPHIFVNVVF